MTMTMTSSSLLRLYLVLVVGCIAGVLEAEVGATESPPKRNVGREKLDMIKKDIQAKLLGGQDRNRKKKRWLEDEDAGALLLPKHWFWQLHKTYLD